MMMVGVREFQLLEACRPAQPEDPEGPGYRDSSQAAPAGHASHETLWSVNIRFCFDKKTSRCEEHAVNY